LSSRGTVKLSVRTLIHGVKYDGVTVFQLKLDFGLIINHFRCGVLLTVTAGTNL